MKIVSVSQEQLAEFNTLQDRLKKANAVMADVTAKYKAGKIDSETWQTLHHAALHEATAAIDAMNAMGEAK